MSEPRVIHVIPNLRLFVAVVLVFLVVSVGRVPSVVHAQTPPPDCPLHDIKAAEQPPATSRYAGFETRPIKALSADQHRQLLAGHGMGLALVAELNHYPGPKHVMELRSELKLTDAQVRETQTIFHEMQARAQSLGKKIVEAEAALEARFGTADIDEAFLAENLANIGQLRADLRLAHLRAHLQMKAVLSAGQVSRYDELRGYGSAKNASD